VYYKLYNKQRSSKQMRAIPKYKRKSEPAPREVRIENAIEEAIQALAKEDSLERNAVVDTDLPAE
jgi:hypothetical protein